MVDHDLVQDSVNEYEPGETGVPRWLAIALAILGSAAVVALGSIAVACYRLMTRN